MLSAFAPRGAGARASGASNQFCDLGLIAGAIPGYILRERSGRAALRQALNQTPIDGSDRSASVFFAHR